jgi:hypothetical protein
VQLVVLAHSDHFVPDIGPPKIKLSKLLIDRLPQPAAPHNPVHEPSPRHLIAHKLDDIGQITSHNPLAQHLLDQGFLASQFAGLRQECILAVEEVLGHADGAVGG